MRNISRKVAAFDDLKSDGKISLYICASFAKQKLRRIIKQMEYANNRYVN